MYSKYEIWALSDSREAFICFAPTYEDADRWLEENSEAFFKRSRAMRTEGGRSEEYHTLAIVPSSTWR